MNSKDLKEFRHFTHGIEIFQVKSTARNYIYYLSSLEKGIFRVKLKIFLKSMHNIHAQFFF